MRDINHSPARIRVLHLLKTSIGATWALRQMRMLTAIGVDVHVALPDGPLVEAYEAAGVMVHRVQLSFPVGKPHRWPDLFETFRQLVQDVRPDIIHSHFVATTLTMRFALGRRHQIPRVFQVPGPLHLEHPLLGRAEIATAGRADHWIGSCEWTFQRYLRVGIPPERVALAYYGTELETYTPHESGTLRRALGLRDDAPIVGMVAYMYAPKRFLGQRRGLKGHEDLIDALAIVKRSIPDVQSVFIGGAWDGATRYEEWVRTYGRERLGNSAHFLGTRPNVPELYADFDVVVHPSHSENVGGAAESLLLRVPTIATSVGGFPDLIKPGQTGWLVPPKSPENLAEAIIESLQDRDKAIRFAIQGQQLARHLMDVRNNARDVLTAYERFLDNR